MSYSTGSGSYIDMMAAVLAHAVADGWIEAGGIGTGWPISKGDVRGVDFSTHTAIENDVTVGGLGGTKTQRYMRLAIGTSTADATANVGTSTAVCPNFAYDIIAWHIFSDTSLCDYVHVVFQIFNGVNSDVYSHFSFGEVNKGGLTYDSIAYATCSGHRGYAADTGFGNNSSDWNSMNRTLNSFCGNVGNDDFSSADGSSGSLTSFIIKGTNAPTPDGTGGWPSWDTLIEDGDSLWAKVFRTNGKAPDPRTEGGNEGPPIDWIGWKAIPPASTGTITLTSMPFLLTNSVLSAGRLVWCGTFPNVRKCPMDGVAPGDEILYASEVWKVFPIVRSTANGLLNTASIVTSGRCGIAFKKVV